jgi:hypothetical protein
MGGVSAKPIFHSAVFISGKKSTKNCRQTRSRLNGLHHGARAEAAGADPDPLVRTPLNRPNPLEIRVPAARGSIVGMAHTVAHPGSFSANFACPSHWFPPKKINSRGAPAYLFFISQSYIPCKLFLHPAVTIQSRGAGTSLVAAWGFGRFAKEASAGTG